MVKQACFYSSVKDEESSVPILFTFLKDRLKHGAWMLCIVGISLTVIRQSLSKIVHYDCIWVTCWHFWSSASWVVFNTIPNFTKLGRPAGNSATI